jgi:glycosyltransferase involved in cell wall biosynthesis
MSPYSKVNNPSLLKLLAVSFAYPPLSVPRAIQVSRLLRHFKESTVLVCADDQEKANKEDRFDPTLELGTEEKLDACVRVPFEVSSWERVINRLSYRFYRPFWNKRNMAPDKYVAWKPQAVHAISTFMKEKSYMPEVLATFGKPFVSHLVGLELKHRYGLPWLAHFSDPWVDNPFSNQHDQRIKQINLLLEQQVIEKADLLAFTSTETIDLVFEKYPAEWKRKARLLPQSFETTLLPARRSEPDSKLIVRYIGHFYGQRTPLPLIETLRLILEKKKDDLADVQFELIGINDFMDTLSQKAMQKLPEGLLLVRPKVSYHESLQLMVDADGLLIIDAPADISVFLPSKLIDYVGAGRPILGLAPPGAAVTLIKQLGGGVAEPTDTEAMIDSMLKFLRFLRHRRLSKDFQVWGTPEIRKRYEAKYVAALFSEMLHELRETSIAVFNCVNTTEKSSLERCKPIL